MYVCMIGSDCVFGCMDLGFYALCVEICKQMHAGMCACILTQLSVR